MNFLKEALIKLLVEEATGCPDYNDDNISRKEKIEKPRYIQNMKNRHFLTVNKNIIITYYRHNPDAYNECDTAQGKQRLSFREDDEPFIKKIVINKNDEIETTR